MQLSARELRHLASDVDDMHHEAMRDFREESADLHLDVVRGARQNARRSFIKKAGIGGAALAAAPSFIPGFNFLPSASALQGLTDTQIAGYAQSIELAAVAAYEAAAAALSEATLPVGQLFLSHHQQHADAFGGIAGDDARPEANAALVAAVTPQLEAITDEAGALEFAFVLENQAAYTYAAGLTLIQDAGAAGAAATILPIEAQHATVIGVALGKPVSDVFPTGAFEAATLGDGSDPKAGLDPAVFA